MSYQKRNIFSLICKKYFLQIKSAKNLSLSSKQLSQNSNISENINENTIKIAIIGSGPAGFYTAQHLLKVGFVFCFIQCITFQYIQQNFQTFVELKKLCIE
jgi:cell division GTPase FtsZ